MTEQQVIASIYKTSALKSNADKIFKAALKNFPKEIKDKARNGFKANNKRFK